MRGFRLVAFDDAFDGGLQPGRVGGVAGLDVVVEDDPVGVVAHLGFVAELDRLPEPAFRDRAGVGVVQTDLAGRAVGDGAGQPLPGLGGDPAGRRQQLGEVVDRADQPATTPAGGRDRTGPRPCVGRASASALRDGAFRVGEQPFGLPRRGLGQLGQLGVLAPHHRQRLLLRGGVAGAQLRVQIMRPPAGGAGPVPELGADRATGGWIRRPVAAIRLIAFASSPESVG